MKASALSLFFLLLTLTNGESIHDFIDGNNLFAADVYKEQIKLQEGNILVSPLSAEIVLAVTQSGAKDKTGEEVRTVLHFPDSENKTKWGIYNYLTSLKPSNGRSYFLHTANKIYIKKDVTLKDDFQDVVTRFYKAQIESIDFLQKTQAVKTINDWVEGQTQNKIRNLIEPSQLDASTALVLVNALYFKGRWFNEFGTHLTKKGNFYKTSSDVVQVDTMYQDDEFYNYFESESLKTKFLELPFKGSRVSLVLALPDDKEGLANLEKHAHEVFSQDQFARYRVNVALPKFKIENKVDLKKILKKLGLSRLFSNQADLSGIAGKKGDLSVSEVLQKTFIDVNEEGVEAAAATAVVAVLGAGYDPRPPKVFVVDHPFIFYIKINNAVIFAGRVVDPSQ